MKIKIFVGIALSLFVIIVSSIGIAGFIIYDQQRSTNPPKLASADMLNAPDSQTDPSLGGITLEEVGKHSTISDCWMVVDGNVYDVTKFINSHPGGSGAIIPYCGRDGSQAFATKDTNPAKSHTIVARDLLNSYYLGRLATGNIAANPQVTLGVNNNPTLNPNNPSTSQNATTLTTTEVARHSTISDCWIIISGNVYNVSSYLSQHPGGVGALSPYCGRDGTTAFSTKDKNPASSHSTTAVNLLGNYFIGRIGSSLASNPSTSGQAPVIIPTLPPANTPDGSTNMTLTSTQVAAHNTLQDCWIIVSGRVYDVTRYIGSHPGGQNAITRHCGQEATTAFQTQDKGSNHSNNAYNLLNNYLIGTLGSSVPVNNPLPGSGTTPIPTSIPGSGGGSCTGSGRMNSVPQTVINKYPGATLREGEWKDGGGAELKVNTSGGCRDIKLDSNCTITSDKSC